MVAILELHLVAQITAHLQCLCVRTLQYKRQPLIHNSSISTEANKVPSLHIPCGNSIGTRGIGNLVVTKFVIPCSECHISCLVSETATGLEFLCYMVLAITHLYCYPGYVDGQAIIRIRWVATLFYTNSCVSSAKMLLACKFRIE